jgi:hypothetical protein
LIVSVPEAEAVVGAWRRRFDPSAAQGVPAHMTVLYPFPQVGDPEALAALFAGFEPFEVVFRGCGRFAETLYLAPEPDARMRELTGAVVARWPSALPYGGAFDDVIPHLTVADGVPGAVLDEISEEVLAGLPVRTLVRAVELWVSDGEFWEHSASYPLM